MTEHQYIPSKEYMEEYNKQDHGLKIYQFCTICHEHAPCSNNKEFIGQRLLNAESVQDSVNPVREN